MKIVMLVSNLRNDALGGGFIYARALIHEIAKREEVILTVYCWKEFADHLKDLEGKIQIVHINSGRYSPMKRWIFDFFKLPILLRGGNPDVFHSLTGYAIPFVPRSIKQFVTIYDLQHIGFPALFSRAERLRRRIFMEISKIVNPIFLPISEFTKYELTNSYRISHSSIFVIPLGCDSYLSQTEFPIEESFKYPFSYAIFPASVARHKNHYELLRAWKIMKDSEINFNLRLILCGRGTQNDQNLISAIKLFGLENYVETIDWVSREEYWRLLRHADFVVFPSMYEGFGLPLLEAMSAGVPVVSTPFSVAREVLGDSGLLANGFTAEEISVSIIVLRTDVTLRNSLIRGGIARAKNFTWDNYTDRLFALYSGHLRQ